MVRKDRETVLKEALRENLRKRKQKIRIKEDIKVKKDHIKVKNQVNS